MIILDIESYCENCLDFLPDVKKPERMDAFYDTGDESEDAYGHSLYSDTIIRCSNRKRCEGIKRYLERQLAKGGKDDGPD